MLLDHHPVWGAEGGSAGEMRESKTQHSYKRKPVSIVFLDVFISCSKPS